jgi:tetratricopeptide (TPR) repeat protein
MLLALSLRADTIGDLLARARALRQSPQAEQAIALYQEAIRAMPEGDTSLPQLYGELADVFMRSSRLEEAKSAYAACVERAPVGAPDSVVCIARGAELATEQEDLAHAEAQLSEGLRQWNAQAAPLQRATLLRPLGKLRYRQHRFHEAVDTYKEALRWLAEASRGSWEALTLECLVRSSLAHAALALGDIAEADAQARAALDGLTKYTGPNEIVRVEPQMALGHVNFVRGNLQAAERNYRTALRLQLGQLPAGHPALAETYCSLGRALLRAGRWREGKDAVWKALEIAQGVYGARSIEAAMYLAELSAAYLRLGQTSEALESGREAVEIVNASRNHDIGVAARAIHVYGAALVHKGDLRRVPQLLESTLQKQLETLGPDHIYLVFTLQLLGQLHARNREWLRAEHYLVRALDIAERKGVGTIVSPVLAVLAGCREHTDVQSAAELYSRARSIQEMTKNTDSLEAYETAVGYARVLRRLKRGREAALFEQIAQELNARLGLALASVDAKDARFSGFKGR